VGLLVIADPHPLSECLRTDTLPLDFESPGITLVRNINPVKIYAETTTIIDTQSTVQLCLGASYEPILADIIQVIDSFTKTTDDPSPPIGWWDKLRHVFHGNNEVQIIGSGSLSVGILGSTSPYFNPRKHFGSTGIQLQFRDNIIFNIGGKADIPQITITCGEFKASIPDNSQTSVLPTSANITPNISSYAFEKYKELCIAKFSGGICLSIYIDFLTKNLTSDTSAEIRPWKNHADITLRTPGNCPHSQSVIVTNIIGLGFICGIPHFKHAFANISQIQRKSN
jgi:hypothetical protein